MGKKPTPTTDLKFGPGPSNREDVPHNSRWNGEFTWERFRKVGENTEIREIDPNDAKREK